MGDSAPLLLPLFPLPKAVLFPGMPLPLHIFEPRYRRMVADALKSHRTIGMVLLRPGWEAEYEGRPPLYPVGCAGVIDRHQKLDDGRYNILLHGQTRFRILEEHVPVRGQAGEPYRLATVRTLADAPGDAEALDGLRRRILAAVARATDGPAALVLQGEVPHEALVNGLCQSLDLAPVEKQSLLDCDTIEARAVRLLEILDFHLLERTSGRRPGVH
jgi:Lon protease-like protein